jgi:hypothetical protein
VDSLIGALLPQRSMKNAATPKTIEEMVKSRLPETQKAKSVQCCHCGIWPLDRPGAFSNCL